MAIVQISRIQQRRGNAQSGAGLPQLASGEFGWAMDTQELFIGNGAVADGAPAVGNTRVLTEYDLLTLLGGVMSSYTYNKDNIATITGADITHPIVRTLQNRLDDRVSTASFTSLQKAIDQIYLNASLTNSYESATNDNRMIINIPAGIHIITAPLLIPSYATIVGAGADKTIIKYSGAAGPVIKFVHDTYYAASPPVPISNTRPKCITLRDLTIQTDKANITGLQLDQVTQCLIENVSIIGNWGSTINVNSRGINLTAISSLVTCELNVFNNINIAGFTYGVVANADINSNIFDKGYISDVSTGFMFGVATGSGDSATLDGQQYGPRDTTISNYNFYDVYCHGVDIQLGTHNIVEKCNFDHVGNNHGGPAVTPVYPNIFFETHGNIAVNNKFDRSAVLCKLDIPDIAYVPEVAGRGVYTSYGDRSLIIPAYSSHGDLFRLPVSSDKNGNPAGVIAYEVEYTYSSSTLRRRGTLSILVNVTAGLMQWNDEYDTVGSTLGDACYLRDSLELNFVFVIDLLDQAGTEYLPSTTEFIAPFSIRIGYTTTDRTTSADDELIYSYTSSF